MLLFLRRLSPLSCALFVSIWACGSSTNAPSAQAACADQARLQCMKLQSCSQALLAIRYGSEATCESRVAANCENALAAPQTGNSPQKTEACANAYAAWSCADFLDDQNVPAACQTAAGQLPAGAACAFPGQCHSGFCAIAPGAACGQCATAPAGGDSCASLTTCGQGLVCVAATSTCMTRAAQGQSCGRGQPCAIGLSCVGATAGMDDGACQPAGQTGAACDPNQRTAPGCDEAASATCDAQSKQCIVLTIASTGQACGSGAAHAVCADGAVCVTANAATTGTCGATAQDGQPCDTAGNGPTCMAPARCILSGDGGTSGTCMLDDAAACH